MGPSVAWMVHPLGKLVTSCDHVQSLHQWSPCVLAGHTGLLRSAFVDLSWCFDVVNGGKNHNVGNPIINLSCGDGLALPPKRVLRLSPSPLLWMQNHQLLLGFNIFNAHLLV